MEKINTPLMALIEELKDHQSQIPENAKQGLYWRGRNEQLTVAISLAEKLLPIEREVIEKAFQDGCADTYCCSHDYHEDQGDYEYILNNQVSPKDYFTQTFKSYE